MDPDSDTRAEHAQATVLRASGDQCETDSLLVSAHHESAAGEVAGIKPDARSSVIKRLLLAAGPGILVW